MKILSVLFVFIIAIILSYYIRQSFLTEQTNEDYLEIVLNNLEEIKSANYFETTSASAPGDTISFSTPRTLFIKEYVNPADTFVGAGSAQYKHDDTTHMTDFYDGYIRGIINWEKHTVRVDSFQDHPYPFRLVNHPFFTRTKSIINYALETDDSIKILFTEYGDSLKFSLTIYNKLMEFVTHPFNDINERINGDSKVSQYDIWINKKTNLPFRIRRKMPHQTSFGRVENVTINTEEELQFIASDYFPEGFKINHYVRKRTNPKSEMEGKPAPDWSLRDINNKLFSLSDINSKVILIQFTGVGCGPCHNSIPFIKQLVDDYRDKDFSFLAIETWSSNMEGLIRYYNKNELSFPFLKNENGVADNYKVISVPVFFVIDKDRIIKKVLKGYANSSTDEKIIDAINNLL